MPYESTNDLPSFVELKRKLAAMKALRLLVPRRDRPDIKDLGRQLMRLSGTVDRFYEVRGERNWVFREHLSVDRVAKILDSSTTPDEAERKLARTTRSSFSARRGAFLLCVGGCR